MYDLIVIGAGAGGYTAAIRAAKAGLKTAIIEKDVIGGTCLNRGCIPVKYMLHRTEHYKELKSAMLQQEYEGQVSLNYNMLLEHMQTKIEKLAVSVESLIKAAGAEVYRGEARFCGEMEICIDDNKILQAKHIIIATGSRPAELAILGGKLDSVYNTDNIFVKMRKLPERLMIIGGGTAGLEMAFLFRELGTEVTLAECRDSLLGKMDRDVESFLQRMLYRNGIRCCLSSKVKEIADDDGLEIVLSTPEKTEVLEADAALVTTGRIPVWKELEIEKSGLREEGAFLTVDEHYRTDREGIYAIGDVNGAHMTAYAASEQAEAVIEHITGKACGMKKRIFPRCIFTHPEIAAAGLTEQQAKEEGRQVSVGKILMTANGRSFAEEQDGFIKLIADKNSGELLGGICVCRFASELIAQITMAVQSRMNIQQFRETVFLHPTYGESLREAAEAENGSCIYMI